jgi:ABC-type uncharacterized transport system substrate-binding protein
MADLVHRRGAVIVTPGSTQTALSAKAATKSIPVVFSVGTDPFEIEQPSGWKRHGDHFAQLGARRQATRTVLELRPNAVRFAVLVNPSNRNAEALTRDAQAAESSVKLNGRTEQSNATLNQFVTSFPSALAHRKQFLTFAPEDRR